MCDEERWKGYARGLEDRVVHGVLGNCLAFQEHHQLQTAATHPMSADAIIHNMSCDALSICITLFHHPCLSAHPVRMTAAAV